MPQRVPWRVLTLEALLVVFSVLLALALNSWREARANYEVARRAAQSVVDEAQANCTKVESLLPYHEAVFSGRREYEGLGRIFLRNDAWASAQTAGVGHHVSYEVAAAFGTVQSLQQDHRRLVEAGILATYITATGQDPARERFPPTEGEDWLRGPHPIMLSDLIRIQRELLAAYDRLFTVSAKVYGIETNDSCGTPDDLRDGDAADAAARS